jgi:hypothetical protein
MRRRMPQFCGIPMHPNRPAPFTTIEQVLFAPLIIQQAIHPIDQYLTSTEIDPTIRPGMTQQMTHTKGFDFILPDSIGIRPGLRKIRCGQPGNVNTAIGKPGGQDGSSRPGSNDKYVEHAVLSSANSETCASLAQAIVTLNIKRHLFQGNPTAPIAAAIGGLRRTEGKRW